jgi:hypothetical protein
MSTGNILGGPNFDALLASQDWTAWRSLLESEILKRFLLSAGSPPNSTPQTGIVDIVNPAEINSTETTRPFLVSVSALNSMTVAVNAGTVVTPSGAVVYNAGSLSLAMARSQLNDVNVIFIENSLTTGGNNLLNDYQQPLWTQDVQNPASLEIVLLTDFNNVSLFPATRLKNIVVIGIVSIIQTAGGGLALSIDLSQSVYSYNRPWFSIKDIQHRSYVGSGTVTTQNPHGTSTNDLTVAGNVGLFQGLSDTGIIVSRDYQINKMTGALRCSESVPLNRILTDSDGSVTARSSYGSVGGLYVNLLGFPTRLGSIYVTGTPANAIAGEIIPCTNILVLAPEELITSPLTVEYTETPALMPPTSTPSNQVTFSQPSAGEVIVSEGLTSSLIPNPTLSLEGQGPFPRRYRIYQKGTGDFITFPQTLVPATLLDAIGTALYTPVVSLAYPARIVMGLTKANPDPAMQVQVEILGVDANGNQITENLLLSTAGGWVDETVPSTNYDSPNQLVSTTQIFASVTNIQVLSRINDGPQSTFQLWGDIEPGTSSAVNDFVAICDALWNGQGIVQLLDVRNISRYFLRDEFRFMNFIGSAELEAGRLLSLINPQLSHTSVKMFSEDFEDLHYFDTVLGTYPTTPAVGSITINNNALLQSGDTITLSPSITLHATVTTPVSANQFQIGPDAASTLSNMVTAINSPGLASGITSTLGSGDQLTMSVNSPVGSYANANQIQTSLVNPTALSVVGFNYGYDAIGECYLDRAQFGLKSFRVPTNSQIVLPGYAWRGRYRSRAVALSYAQGIQKTFAAILHGMDISYPSSVRIRGSYGSNPQVWTPWQLMTVASPGVAGVYSFTFSEPVYKVQIEIYGKARGVSVFNLVPN